MTPDWGDTRPIPELPKPDDGLAGAVSRLEQQVGKVFATRPLGGYDRPEVDAFMAELANSVAALRTAFNEDRRELASLRAENTKLAASANSDLEQEVTLGAVGLLSQAQMIADKAVADAEQYARDLVLAARTQYREALERDAERAAAATAAAPATPAAAAAPVAMPPMPEIEYVRTYAQVAQIQLRSVLDALTEQVDRLGTLPQPETQPTAVVQPGTEAQPGTGTVAEDDEFPDEEPDWLPAVPPQPTIQRQTYISPTM